MVGVPRPPDKGAGRTSCARSSRSRRLRKSELVAAPMHRGFAQPDAEHVHERCVVMATMFDPQLTKVEQLFRGADETSSP